MKKTNLFIICLFSLCCVLTLSAQDNDSYTLDFQQKIRPQFVSDITVNGEQGYLFIQHIQDYSPTTHPGVITDVMLQQSLLGESFVVFIKSNSDFNLLALSPPFMSHENYYHTQVRVVVDEVYFYGKEVEGGAVPGIVKWGSDNTFTVSNGLQFDSSTATVTFYYYGNKIYVLRNQYYDMLADEVVLGELWVLDLDNNQLTQYQIGDPTAAFIVYKGIAVDETGIYISGNALYSLATTNQPLSDDFYYSEGAYQECMTCNAVAMNASFLSSYSTTNPEIRNWSTYIGGTGNIMPSVVNTYNYNSNLKIIDGDVYMADLGIGAFSNFTTPGVYEEDESPGPFLMRFSTGGELLMGTRLIQGLGSVSPTFAYGEQSAAAITIGFHVPATAEAEPTTADAPMTTPPGNADLFIGQFDSSGNRLFATYWGGNLYDQYVGLVAEDNQFTGFFGYDLFQNNPWNEEPDYEITSEDVLLDYAPFQNNDSLAGLHILKNRHVYRLSKEKSSSTDVHTHEQIKVFPNPTADLLQIHLGGATMDEIVIYDTQGKEVKRFQIYGANQATLDVSQLSRGVYLLQLKGNQHTENIHFVKK